jgi:UDP-2,4-diacetamido-2,4,6-trideoxy-beta-L-altropyranose hydrolase
MNIAFRVDGSKNIGMGHLIRCIHIAKKLNKKSNILFIIKDYEEATNLLKREGMKFELINKEYSIDKESRLISRYLDEHNINLLITDILRIKKDYSQEIREKGIKIISLDYLGESKFQPDIYINTSLVKKWHLNYEPRKADIKYYLGPDYVILPNGIKRFIKKNHEIKKLIRKITIAIGGSDKNNITYDIIRSLENKKYDFQIDVVLGPGFINKEKIKSILRDAKIKNNYRVLESVKSIAKQIYKSDLMISGAGELLYQIAAIGTPVFIIPQTSFERLTAKEFESRGFGICFNKEDVNKKIFLERLENLIEDYELRKSMNKKGKKLIKLNGINNIVRLIENV